MEIPLDCFLLDFCFLFSNCFHLIMLVMLFFVLIAHCWNMDDGHSCSLSKYWSSGFVALQAAINAAIIQVRKVLIIKVS